MRGVLVLIGLLIGLERERRADSKAGLRTFALVGMLGCVSGLLSQTADSGWIIAAGLVVLISWRLTLLATKAVVPRTFTPRAVLPVLNEPSRCGASGLAISTTCNPAVPAAT